MRKIFLILALIIIIPALIKTIMPNLEATENNDEQEVRGVIKSFIETFWLQDPDSSLQYLSSDFSIEGNNKAAGLELFKSKLKKGNSYISKTHVDSKLSELLLTEFNFQDSQVSLQVEFIIKGFNLDSIKDDEIKIKRSAVLRKEDGVWKIVKWEPLR